MKLYQQLILFVVAATAIPMLVGLGVLHHSEQQMAQQLIAARLDAAKHLAGIANDESREVLERVQAALGYMSTSDMNKEEWKGLLGIIYKQSETISQVALVDPQAEALVPGVYLAHPEKYPEYRHRKAISAVEHRKFLKQLPMRRAEAAGPGSVVLGSISKSPNAAPSLNMLFPLSKPGQLLALQWSLSRVLQRIQDSAFTQGFNVTLVDENGQFLGGFAEREERILQATQSAVTRMQAGMIADAFFDKDRLIAYSRVGLTGWGVVLHEKHDSAWAEVKRSRLVTMTGTGFSILALLLLGGLFTGRINKNLRKMAAGAEAFARGDLSTRVEVKTRDELGLLAKTFNLMGEELQASREEIEGFNRELAQRVEERTHELAVAHQRLLQTNKLAAIGQLGAGVAHEVNNPLVGILGNVQLLKLKGPEWPKRQEVLEEMEGAAKRCRDVIQRLLRFSELDAESEHSACDINQVLLDAHSLMEQRLLSQGIKSDWLLDEQLPEILGDHRQLMQVFLNLFSNALTAMPDGGKLNIQTMTEGKERLLVEVRDDGVGIPSDCVDKIFDPFFTSKDVWTNTGLGLSESYRIITDHGGRIDVESKLGEGSLFRIELPWIGNS
ncbi:MAG: HAMP domain-containing protein [Deltaproteobacteria bacterium]|nr:HAMP domain-containing protein [Deltaproteobacteria bacterium]